MTCCALASVLNLPPKIWDALSHILKKFCTLSNHVQPKAHHAHLLAGTYTMKLPFLALARRQSPPALVGLVSCSQNVLSIHILVDNCALRCQDAKHQEQLRTTASKPVNFGLATSGQRPPACEGLVKCSWDVLFFYISVHNAALALCTQTSNHRTSQGQLFDNTIQADGLWPCAHAEKENLMQGCPGNLMCIYDSHLAEQSAPAKPMQCMASFINVNSR